MKIILKFFTISIMNTQKGLNFLHQVYKNDPILLESYVGKRVKVIMKDENIHCGVVYTVDPVSESIVLLQSKTSVHYRLKIIFNHSIKTIQVTSEAEMLMPIAELFSSAPAKLSQAVITKRKNIIIQLLLDNQFPVKEKDDILLIQDNISIEPPYYPENCRCTNSIILNKLQDIIKCINVE